MLNFSKSDIDSLYRAFYDIDVHHCGSVRPIELFTYFNIEVGAFEEAMFSVFDEDKSGKLTFLEFVCSMWNLLSMPANILGSLCYLIKDPTGTMRVHYSDIRDVLEMMHRKKVETASSLSLIMSELKNKYSAELSVQDICKWTTINSSIMSPIVIMQLKFRKQLLGEKYWSKAADVRAADKERSTVEWMRKFFEMIHKKSAEQRRLRKEAAMSTAHKRENLSESQKNIHDKQTLLLSSFNMLQQPANGRGPTADENAQISPSVKKKRRQSGDGFGSPAQPQQPPQRVVPGGGSGTPNGISRDGSVKSRKAPSSLDMSADAGSGADSQQPSPKRPSSSRKSSTKNFNGEGSSPAQPPPSRPKTSSQADLGGRKGSTRVVLGVGSYGNHL
eukprot:gene16225-11610_t